MIIIINIFIISNNLLVPLIKVGRSMIDQQFISLIKLKTL